MVHGWIILWVSWFQNFYQTVFICGMRYKKCALKVRSHLSRPTKALFSYRKITVELTCPTCMSTRKKTTPTIRARFELNQFTIDLRQPWTSTGRHATYHHHHHTIHYYSRLKTTTNTTVSCMHNSQNWWTLKILMHKLYQQLHISHQTDNNNNGSCFEQYTVH